MPATLVELKKSAIINTLRSCQLFTGLPPEDLENVADVAVVKGLERGEYLFHEGDPAFGFYIVQRGAVNVHRVTATGKEQIIHVFRTGDSFAERSEEHTSELQSHVNLVCRLLLEKKKKNKKKL